MGSTAYDIYNQMAKDKIPVPVAARVNNKTVSLSYEIYNPKQIEFIDIYSSSGMRAYVRTLTFLLASAIEELYPGCEFRLEHPVSKGYFCELDLGRPIKIKDLEDIKVRMRTFIEADNLIEYQEDETAVIIDRFQERGRKDIVNLLQTKGALYSTYWKMGWHIDYYYGALAMSAGFIQLFDLKPYFNGFLLQIPDRKNPSRLEEIVPQFKMLGVFNEYVRWNKIMSLSNVGDLNLACMKGESTNLINISESLQEKKIGQIADMIGQQKGVRIILISGPSSSGKTTFAKRLSIQLMVMGIKPVSLSLDNYFVIATDALMKMGNRIDES
jgi:uridine kinase